MRADLCPVLKKSTSKAHCRGLGVCIIDNEWQNAWLLKWHDKRNSEKQTHEEVNIETKVNSRESVAH